MLKRIIAIALSLFTVVAVVSGCGKEEVDTSKAVTLIWNIGWSQQKDYNKVMAEVNTQLGELLPNTKLEFMTAGPDTWSLLMAAKEPIDIAWTGYQYDMNSEVNSESFLPLNDLVEEYGPDIQKEMEIFKKAYQSGTVDGELLAIPNEQPILHQTSYLAIPEAANQYFDGDAFLEECHSNYKTTEKVYQIIEQYLEKCYNAGLYNDDRFCGSIDIQNIFLAIAIRGYDWVDTYRAGAYLCYDIHDPDAKIVNFQQTDAYKLFIRYAAKWYQKGYIAEDVLTSVGGGIGGDYFASANVTEMWYGLDDERGIRIIDGANSKIYNYLTDPIENLYQGTDMLGREKTYTVIPYTAKNPERAMMLINLLRSEEGRDLLNLIVYGIEGEHYTLEGDVAIGNGYTTQATSANDYGIPHWKIGNVFLTYRTPNILDGQIEYAMDYIENVEPTLYKTPLYNFRAETRSLSNKIIQAKQVVSEFQDTLICGIMGAGYEATYNELIDKLNAAGMQDLLDALNQQAQEYMEEN